MTQGRVRRSWLGIVAQNRRIDPRIRRHLELLQESGVEVMSVEPSGPAAAAGVRDGDIVLALDGRPVQSVDDVHRTLTQWPVGKTAAAGAAAPHRAARCGGAADRGQVVVECRPWPTKP